MDDNQDELKVLQKKTHKKCSATDIGLPRQILDYSSQQIRVVQTPADAVLQCKSVFGVPVILCGAEILCLVNL